MHDAVKQKNETNTRADSLVQTPREQHEDADRLRRDEEDRRRRQEEASRPSHDTGDLGSPASNNTGDL